MAVRDEWEYPVRKTTSRDREGKLQVYFEGEVERYERSIKELAKVEQEIIVSLQRRGVDNVSVCLDVTAGDGYTTTLSLEYRGSRPATEAEELEMKQREYEVAVKEKEFHERKLNQLKALLGKE